jgi:hypothetical protein
VRVGSNALDEEEYTHVDRHEQYGTRVGAERSDGRADGPHSRRITALAATPDRLDLGRLRTG